MEESNNNLQDTEETKKIHRSITGYLVNPKLQISIIIYVTLIMAIVLLQFYIFISNFNQDVILLINSSGVPQAQGVIDTISQMFTNEWTAFFYLFLIIYLFFLIIGGIVLSHRIAGPMAKLKNHLDSCTEKNELTPINFRDGDFFADVAESFNAAIAGNKKKE